MKRIEAINSLGLTDKQLDWLEDDYLKIHKEYIDKVLKLEDYPSWYVEALREWKAKRL